MRAHPPLLGLANALLLALLAVALLALVETMVLNPLAALRTRAAKHALHAELDRLQPHPLTRWQASAGLPAVLAIARDGHVLLADASTDYVPVRLRPDAILSVEPVLMTVPSRVARGSLGIGIGVRVGAGLVVAPLSAPVRPTTGHTRHAVALGYRLGRDGAARTTRLRCRDAGDAQCLALALREIPPLTACESAPRR